MHFFSGRSKSGYLAFHTPAAPPPVPAGTARGVAGANAIANAVAQLPALPAGVAK
jgi:hypothetical protein